MANAKPAHVVVDAIGALFTWLTTINPDGSPHVTGIGALWLEGAFWFETGARTRKGRNLARDPRCALSVATHDFDLVVEGAADQITDPPTVATMAAQWAEEGWSARVDDQARPATNDRVGRLLRQNTLETPGICDSAWPTVKHARTPTADTRMNLISGARGAGATSTITVVSTSGWKT